MVTKAERSIKIVYSGEVGGTQEIEAADNDESPQMIQVVTCDGNTVDEFEEIVLGVVVVDIPDGATAVTIMKPSDYTGTIRLGIDGIYLHPTDPDSISLGEDTGELSFYCSEAISLRLFWS